VCSVQNTSATPVVTQQSNHNFAGQIQQGGPTPSSATTAAMIPTSRSGANFNMAPPPVLTMQSHHGRPVSSDSSTTIVPSMEIAPPPVLTLQSHHGAPVTNIPSNLEPSAPALKTHSPLPPPIFSSRTQDAGPVLVRSHGISADNPFFDDEPGKCCKTPPSLLTN
jgi:hypothetical protein